MPDSKKHILPSPEGSANKISCFMFSEKKFNLPSTWEIPLFAMAPFHE